MDKQVLSTTAWGAMDRSMFIASNNDIIAMYADYAADGYIKYRVSTDGGITWGTEKSLLVLSGHTFSHIITCPDANIVDTIYAAIITGVDCEIKNNAGYGLLADTVGGYGGILSYNTSTHELSYSGFSRRIFGPWQPFYHFQYRGSLLADGSFSVSHMDLPAMAAYGTAIMVSQQPSSISMCHDGTDVYIYYKKVLPDITSWASGNVVTQKTNKYENIWKFADTTFGTVADADTEYMTYGQVTNWEEYDDQFVTITNLDSDHFITTSMVLGAVWGPLRLPRHGTIWRLHSKSTPTQYTTLHISHKGILPRVINLLTILIILFHTLFRVARTRK